MPASYEARAKKRGVDGATIKYKEIFRLQPGETPNRWDKRIAAAKREARERLARGESPARVLAYFDGWEYKNKVNDEIVKNLSHRSAVRVLSRHTRDVADQYKLYIRYRRELRNERVRERNAERAQRRKARRAMKTLLRRETRARLEKLWREWSAPRREREKLARRAKKAARTARLRELREEKRKRLQARKRATRARHAAARRQARMEKARNKAMRARLKAREKAAKKRRERQEILAEIRAQKHHVQSLYKRMRAWLYGQRELVIVRVKDRLQAREEEVIRFAREKGIARKDARRRIIKRIVSTPLDNCIRHE